MNKKVLYLGAVGALAVCGVVGSVQAQYHATFYGLDLLPASAGQLGPGADLGGAAGRALGAAVKYFLADDQDMEAELVFKEGTAKGCGGCGGCYGGKSATSIQLNANLIPVEIDESIYDVGTELAQADVKDLAKQRIRSLTQEQASLDELELAKKQALYDAQQRSIQALANALVMKNAYKSLGKVVDNLGSSYSDYASAASEVATRRLLLDELIALKKRVVAARVRTRAQTVEMTIDQDKKGTPEIN